MFKKKSQKGFTLIELLVTVTIITVLAVTVFVALNPADRLKDAKDARRTSDVDAILTAIHESIIDNGGSYPSNMPAADTEVQLGTGTAADCSPLATGGCSVAALTACVNLMTGSLNLSKYLKTMPIDPIGGTTWTSTKTGYSVVRDANGIVTVKACAAEGTTNISASR